MVGRVGRPHGLRGEVLVDVQSDNPLRFAVGSELELNSRTGKRRRLKIQRTRPQGKRLAIQFEGVEDRDGAEALVQGVLEVETPTEATAPEGHYYYYQLVGCECHDRMEGFLGVVEDVVEDGGGVLLEVRDPQRELLIPFVDPFLHRIDLPNRRIDLELPAGLIETCASKSSPSSPNSSNPG